MSLSIATILALQTDVLDKMTLAVALFDEDRRLINNNSQYARMWSLPQDWLDTRPTLGDILDRLRQARLLPEQRDFTSWKELCLAPFREGGHRVEDYWHLPGGLSLRVISQRHPQGGMFMTFEDVTEVLDLKAANAALIAVQKVTLDAMEEAVAIFQPDGRLVQANKAFMALWRLTEAELACQPHFKKIAALCTMRIGRDGVWDSVATMVASQSIGQFGAFAYVTRADGRELSLAPTRLPNGATLVVFHDMTDIERFDALFADEAHDAA